MKTPWLIFLGLCLLLCVSLSIYAAFSSYFNGNNERDETLAQINDRLQAIETKLAQAPPPQALREIPASLAPSNPEPESPVSINPNFAASIPVPPPPPSAPTASTPAPTTAVAEIQPSPASPTIITKEALSELEEVPPAPLLPPAPQVEQPEEIPAPPPPPPSNADREGIPQS